MGDGPLHSSKWTPVLFSHLALGMNSVSLDDANTVGHTLLLGQIHMELFVRRHMEYVFYVGAFLFIHFLFGSDVWSKFSCGARHCSRSFLFTLFPPHLLNLYFIRSKIDG